jgi:hypothetical protein
MPLHPNVRRCTHIQVTGHRCGSPALKQEYFCYFHTRMIKGVQTRVDSQIHPVALIENAESIQAALMHMIDAVLKGTIDNKRANIILKALHIATRNSRNVYFRLRPDDMVREVPNYAEQYLAEHPELNPPEPNTHVAPDALVRGAEQSSAEDCPPEAAQAFAKRRPANEGSLHSPADRAVLPNKESHPEQARIPPPDNGSDRAIATATNPAAERRQNAARGASRGNKAENHQAPEERKTSCDPPHVKSEPGTPPLTNRQSQHWEEIKKLEASIEGAMHGNWRELRTVFNAVGLTPRKPLTSQKVAPRKKVRGG